jgi:hypothetical protein
MRFSTKRLLAAAAYVALASAAVSSDDDVPAQMLWAVSVVAFAYSVLAALFGDGERRAKAAGFAVGWAAYYWLYLAPGYLPSRQRGINQVGVWFVEFVAINAIGTMVAGLIGCGLGVLAFRRGRSRP